MTPDSELLGESPTTAAPADAAAPVEMVNPRLSASLRADYEALRNDVQQANEMAGHFQKQLAGKSNEFALLKQVFEKTCEDLSHLQAGITALREERHTLANEAMRAPALEMKLGRATAERDRLRVEVEVIRNALAHATEEWERSSRQRDKQIADLTVQVANLKQALHETHGKSDASARSRALREPKTAASERITEKDHVHVGNNDDFIDITFEA